MYDLASVFNNEQPEYLVTNITLIPKGGTVKNYVESLAKHFKHSKIIVSGFQIKQFKGSLPENVLHPEGISSFIEYVQRL
jgi:hypothetical protein